MPKVEQFTITLRNHTTEQVQGTRLREHEEWRPINGYEGWYEVSNCGRVRSLDRTIAYKDGHVHEYKGRLLKSGTDRDGYLLVSLHKNGKVKAGKVHRLVAQAFIPNPDKLPQVNHKNENKQDNRVSNLEWCSAKYNINYGSGKWRKAESRHVPVCQRMLNGKLVATYRSVTEASIATNIAVGSIVYAYQNGTTSTGYIWEKV